MRFRLIASLLMMTGMCWLVFAQAPNPVAKSQAPVTALAYRPDGKLLAAAGQHEVLLIDIAANDLVVRMPIPAAKVTVLAFSKDGLKLAVGGGDPGKTGDVRIYQMPPSPPMAMGGVKPTHTIAAHKDLIHDLAFSPDGKLLATCSYDRLIKLWDVETGKEVRTLKDHSDAVYGVAFRPDGKLLASAAADRAVKIWDVATGKRLYSLGEATDWLYCVTWTPDGKRVAAGGIDKSIRVWDANETEGKVAQSVFAHEKAVLRLAYSSDGKTLYSLSEDRTVKSWDVARMVEKRVYGAQPEALLALAIRPDHKQIALGRYDGVAVLLEEATGKEQGQPLPIKPKPPVISKLTPSSSQRGQTVRIALEGKYLEGITEASLNVTGATVKMLSGTSLEITTPPLTTAGVYQLTVKNPVGASAPQPFIIDAFFAVSEQEGNDAASRAQSVSVPASIIGQLNKAGDVDFYRFDLKANQELGVQVVLPPGSKLDSVLEIRDLKGELVAEGQNGVLGFSSSKAEALSLEIRDREYRGGAEMSYRLHIGDLPVVTTLFPLGIQRGSETTIWLQGANLEFTDHNRAYFPVKAAAETAVGGTLPVPFKTRQGTPLGLRNLVVGEFPEVSVTVEKALDLSPTGENPRGNLPVPGTANGLGLVYGHADLWTFPAKKGERLIVETNARRLGSPADTVIEIVDQTGKPVPRATLRSVAKSFVTFRDHDSAQANIRVDAWSELAINDYIYVGNELIRIKELPTHPDADMNFFKVGGQRLGYLDTTPAQLPFAIPMYKVEIHPLGTKFPPNGFPVFDIYYRNDDAPGLGKDSRLVFDPPADGTYMVRVSDARGASHRLPSVGLAYRLTIRPPKPGFNVSFTPTAPAVWKGNAIPITVNAERIDGYEGPIEVRLENLPTGLTAPVTTIPIDENSTSFALYAEPNAVVPANAPKLKLIAKSHGLPSVGLDLSREVVGDVPKVVDSGDIVTATEESAITIRPGGETRLTVRIERKNGFAGRIPIELRGLPHGMKVQDIGLNGILITEKETVRTMRLYCEPWVQPTERPIVVLAKHEKKNTEHAAKSVLLRVSEK